MPPYRIKNCYKFNIIHFHAPQSWRRRAYTAPVVLFLHPADAKYPLRSHVLQNNPHKVTVDRMQLMGALRRVSIFSSQASSLIKLRMQENQIVVSAQDIDFSTSAEETQVCQYAGAAMSIGFKSTFLIDILNNISADEVVIELADPSRAGVIIPVEQEENEDLLMLLMPMMLND